MSLQANYGDAGVVEIWELCEGGGALVRCHPDGRVELFEIPQYGGQESFEGIYPSICAALADAKNWN